MLGIIGTLLVGHFTNKTVDMSLRTSSLDYLGTVAARLRRDATLSQLDDASLNAIIGKLTREEEEVSHTTADSSRHLRGCLPSASGSAPVTGWSLAEREECWFQEDEEASVFASASARSAAAGRSWEEPSEDRVQILERALMDYLLEIQEAEPTKECARMFYVAQWYMHAMSEEKRAKDQAKEGEAQVCHPTLLPNITREMFEISFTASLKHRSVQLLLGRMRTQTLPDCEISISDLQLTTSFPCRIAQDRYS